MTRKPGVLQSMVSQRLGHNLATELNWTECNFNQIKCFRLFKLQQKVVSYRENLYINTKVNVADCLYIFLKKKIKQGGCSTCYKAIKTAYKITVIRLNVMLVKKETNQQWPVKDPITNDYLIYNKINIFNIVGKNQAIYKWCYDYWFTRKKSV